MNEEHQRALALAVVERYIKCIEAKRARRRRLIILSLGLYAVAWEVAAQRHRIVLALARRWDWNKYPIDIEFDKDENP